jgi:hypothetical protein
MTKVNLTQGELVRLAQVLTEVCNNHDNDDLGLCVVEISEGVEEATITLFEYDEAPPLPDLHEFEGDRYMDKPLVRYKAFIEPFIDPPPIERIDLRKVKIAA